MFEVLCDSIRKKIDLDPADESRVKLFFKHRRVRRKQFLSQQGEVCKYFSFTERGLLRLYTVDKKGQEHTMQFTMEGWWVVDLDSFIGKQPAVYSIEALEDSDMLMLDHASFHELLRVVPPMERYFRIIYQNNIISKERRLISVMSEAAEDRYTRLTGTLPDVFNRVPLNQIASYLGMSAETLSRIRRNLMRK